MSRPSPRPRPTPGVRTPDPDVEPVTADAGPRPGRAARRQHAARSRRAQRTRSAAVLTAAVLVVVAALVVAVTVIRRNVDQDTPAAGRSASPTFAGTSAVLLDQAAAEGFVAGASSAISAVTSYDYRDLDSALAAGLEVTTGEYRTAYRSALQGTLGATARRDRLVQSFETLGAGIGQVASDGRSAKVLLFGVETVTSDKGATRATPTTLTATVVRQGDRYLIRRLEVGANAGLPPGSPQLAVAAETGRAKLIDLLSYRRASFAADLRRALAGTVDPLRTSVAANADSTRAAMDKGGYDLSGTVTAVAVQRASGTSVILLVAATGSRVVQDGGTAVDNDARVRVTVVRVADGWRVSDVQPVAS